MRKETKGHKEGNITRMEHYKVMMMIKFLENPILVIFLLLLALNYSYFFIPKLPKGISRILALAPIFHLLYLLPWCFSLSLLRGILSFFITWITSFKLILLCFNKGPLSICKNPIDFILISIFPLEISSQVRQKYETSNENSIEKPKNKPNFTLVFSTSIYKRYEVEEIFKKPYLATSFQDFWGRRWNRYSSKMLRLTIYEPTHETLKKMSFVGEKTSRVLAIVCTFVVSAIMHELMFYYITCGLCLKPTCEVMWFFVLQGICISCERVFQAKKNWLVMMDPRVSILLKRIFIVFSFYFLLVLPVMREGKDTCER